MRQAQSARDLQRELLAILAAEPMRADAWHAFGRLALSQSDRATALHAFERAHRNAPDDPGYRYQLAALYLTLGAPERCLQFLRATGNPPEAFVAQHGLLTGRALASLGQWAEALDAFDMATAAEPENPEIGVERAAAMLGSGKLEDGVADLQRVFDRHPESPAAATALAGTLARLRRQREMQAVIERHVATARSSLLGWSGLRDRFEERGELPLAMHCARQAIAARPEDAENHDRAGNVARRLGRTVEALKLLMAATDLRPSEPVFWNNLGNVHSDRGDRAGALAAYEKAIALDPDFILGHANLCRLYVEVGRIDDGVASAKTVLARPDLPADLIPVPFSVLQLSADFDAQAPWADRIWSLLPAMGPESLEGALLATMPLVTGPNDEKHFFAQQRRWGALVKAAADRSALPPLKPPAPATDRRIRIGLLSSDLRRHAVGTFAKPLIDNFDRDRFGLHCYSPWPGPTDSVQDAISGAVDAFVSVREMSAQDIARRIRSDDIDVLIELNGPTRFNRLHALAWRAAPVQIHWLGYPYSLGMPGCDYLLLDPHCRPSPGAPMAERPLVMPDTLFCFDPDDPSGLGGAPEVGPAPSQDRGHITFGSFNKPYKITPQTVALWARVLEAISESRFMLVRPEAAGKSLCDNLTRAFVSHGIDPDRLRFKANPPHQHLDLYREVDIVLDTVPMTGGTNVVEALWMGVPVVTLTGQPIFSRVATSILRNAGLSELATASDDDYITTAAATADRARIAELRKSMRVRLRGSPLCQPADFARGFEAALHTTLAVSS